MLPTLSRHLFVARPNAAQPVSQDSCRGILSFSIIIILALRVSSDVTQSVTSRDPLVFRRASAIMPPPMRPGLVDMWVATEEGEGRWDDFITNSGC